MIFKTYIRSPALSVIAICHLWLLQDGRVISINYIIIIILCKTHWLSPCSLDYGPAKVEGLLIRVRRGQLCTTWRGLLAGNDDDDDDDNNSNDNNIAVERPRRSSPFKWCPVDDEKLNYRPRRPVHSIRYATLFYCILLYYTRRRASVTILLLLLLLSLLLLYGPANMFIGGHCLFDLTHLYIRIRIIAHIRQCYYIRIICSSLYVIYRVIYIYIKKNKNEKKFSVHFLRLRAL